MPPQLMLSTKNDDYKYMLTPSIFLLDLLPLPPLFLVLSLFSEKKYIKWTTK